MLIREEIYMKALKRTRELVIYVPDDFESSHKRYPVLIINDGQNAFFDEESYMGVSWRMLDSVESMNVDVIMALNDPTALGALAAIDSLNYQKDVLVYGVDGSPDGKKLINEGLLTGTAQQSPKVMGETAVETIYKLFRIMNNIVLKYQIPIV